jgi:nicotinamide mononucleotide transporter
LSLLEPVLAALAAVSALEWVAVGLAFGYLLLAIAQNAWCWVCAIASGALYLVLFLRAGLVMQAALQVFYIGMSVYGWREWRGTQSHAPVAIQSWRAGTHVLAIAAVALVTAINGVVIAGNAGPSMVPYADAAVAWASVLATWMVARKVLENWLYWVVVDLAAAALYWSQGLYATAALFVVYAALAVRGYQQWSRDARSATAIPT